MARLALLSYLSGTRNGVRSAEDEGYRQRAVEIEILEEACSEGWRRVERRRRVVPSEADSRETGDTVGTNLRRTYRIFCRWLSSLYVCNCIQIFRNPPGYGFLFSVFRLSSSFPPSLYMSSGTRRECFPFSVFLSSRLDALSGWKKGKNDR